MIVAHNIRVSTLSRDSLTITWEIVETSKDLATYTVEVLRSDSEVGPYEVVSPGMNAQDHYSFVDSGVNRFSFMREFYYRIRVTGPDSSTWDWGSTPYEDVVRLGRQPGGVVMETPPDLEAAEAIRQFEMNLREFIGNRVVLLKRRRWGQKCPMCWDGLKGQRVRTRCLTCFDTTWTGGFFAPQETWWMNTPPRLTQQLTPLMKLEVNDEVRWVSARPRVLPEDVLIGADGRRWMVLQLPNMAQKLGSLTRQTVLIRQITREQVEWDIPLNGWDADTFTQAPHRQFIRATDIDEYHRGARELGVGEETPNQVRGFYNDIDEAQSS